MYNRYIPQPDGSYRRSRIPDPQPPAAAQPQVCQPEPQEPPCPQPPPPVRQEPRRREPEKGRSSSAGDFLRQLLPRDLDTGDLMILLLLLLMAGDCQEDKNTALLTLAIYLLM